MKRTSFLIFLITLLLSFGIANAQVHHTSLDHVVGEWDDNGTRMLTPGTVNEFHIRFTNNGTPDCIYAPAFSFVFQSLDGAEWGGITTEFPEIKYKWILPNLLGIDERIPDLFTDFFEEQFTADGGPGAGSDTVGYAGIVFDGDFAFWEGMDTVAIILSITPTVASEGKTICFDYGMARTDGFNWGWNGVGAECTITSATTTTDGRQCFGVGKPRNLPPLFENCPTTITGSHCEVLTYDFDAVDMDPGEGPGTDIITYSADLGTIDPATGVWSYTGDLAGVGSAITLTVTAHEADNPETTDCVVNIVLTNEAPEFTDGCSAFLFAQTGVTKRHEMAGADNCSGDPMIMSVVDADGITGRVKIHGTTLWITGDVGANIGLYYITVGISDGVDDGANCVVTVNFTPRSGYGVEIEKIHNTLQGGFVQVAIDLTYAPPDFGGFNFLIAYDASALTFQGAAAGPVFEYCEWEYFTYRFGADGNCNGGCPSGLVRMVGITETNNGSSYPVAGCVSNQEIFPPVTTLAILSFLVSNDRTLECQYVPIRFFWIDCGDNTISNEDGTRLYIASTVKEYPGDGANLMDIYTDAELPTFVGPVGCLIEDKVEVLADINFLNGGIDIVCADSIDDRGDLNLDGLAYTIADAVMYSNYFVYGMTALVDVTTRNQYWFIPHYAGSVAASDVNADGLSLTVADLVYLIRVVVGDAQPYDKLSTTSVDLIVGSSLSIGTAHMGGAYVVLAGNQSPTLTADGMEMKSSFDGENTRVLVWSQEGKVFSGEFLSNVGDIISTELASVNGEMVMTKLVPANFALGQNYPNPFNPTTAIELSLPVASDYTLIIYNVTGQVVETFSGTAEAGLVTVNWDASNIASGVYFYKLTADNFSDTKKMVLLK